MGDNIRPVRSDHADCVGMRGTQEGRGIGKPDRPPSVHVCRSYPTRRPGRVRPGHQPHRLACWHAKFNPGAPRPVIAGRNKAVGINVAAIADPGRRAIHRRRRNAEDLKDPQPGNAAIRLAPARVMQDDGTGLMGNDEPRCHLRTMRSRHDKAAPVPLIQGRPGIHHPHRAPGFGHVLPGAQAGDPVLRHANA